jgi:WD40 repeat protein
MFKTNKASVNSLCFSPSSNTLFSCSQDSFLRGYNTPASSTSSSTSYSYYQVLVIPISSSPSLSLSLDYLTVSAYVSTLDGKIFDIGFSLIFFFRLIIY